MLPSKRIKDLIEDNKISYVELEKKTGIAKSSIQRYASGVTKKIPIDAVMKLAPILGVTAAYIMGWEDKNNENTYDDTYNFPNIFPIETKLFPLLGEIACGEPIFAIEDRESYVEAGTNVKADFCIKAKGDSMIGARIHDGDIVFIRRQNMVENGEIAAVIIDDEATLKRVYYNREQNKLSLNAENPKYEPLMYFGEELNHIVVLGKAVAFQSDIK